MAQLCLKCRFDEFNYNILMLGIYPWLYVRAM